MAVSQIQPDAFHKKSIACENNRHQGLHQLEKDMLQFGEECLLVTLPILSFIFIANLRIIRHAPIKQNIIGECNSREAATSKMTGKNKFMLIYAALIVLWANQGHSQSM